MRKLMKVALALCGVLIMSATSASAQKFGCVDVQEILLEMPGLDAVQTQLQTFYQELMGQLEIMQVEQNKKFDEYQKTSATMSEAVKRDKEREIASLSQRMQEFQQQAQLDLSSKEQELTKPLVDKIDAAIEKVSKANGIIAVFNVNVLEYFDKNALTDVGPMVKKELGIK